MTIGMVIAATSGLSAPCALPFEVVATEMAARDIAQIVISAGMTKVKRRHPAGYTLSVTYLPDRRRRLVIELAKPINGVRVIGGGGWGMEIAACDGAVSDVHIQR